MMTGTDPDLRSCQKCGKAFKPRSGSGGSVQRFCCTGCRLDFHRERLRSQRRACTLGGSHGPLPLTPNAGPQGLPIGFVQMRQQDVIEVSWDECGNLLLRQGRRLRGDHELHVCRDYFPHFLETIDALRELIADAIRKDEDALTAQIGMAAESAHGPILRSLRKASPGAVDRPPIAQTRRAKA
jgi:hypothetical protein